MIHLIDSPYGKVSIEPKVQASYKGRGSCREDSYDPAWRRSVTIRSAPREGESIPYLPFKVNRTEVSFCYDFSARRRFNESFEEFRKYTMDFNYCNGFCFRIGTSEDAPEGVVNKVRAWIQGFLHAWLVLHPEVWMQAEYEGRLEEQKRLDALAEELRKQINETHAEANRMFCEAVELENKLKRGV